MSIVGDLIVGALTVLFGLGGALYAAGSVRELAEAVRVVTGPVDDPTAGGDGERRTYLSLTVADAPALDAVTLGQVHDTFGYWLVRYWASGSTSNAFGLAGGVLMRVLYVPDGYRAKEDRRRGWAVVPSEVPVRVDGRRFGVSFGDDVVPLQRLEADGGTVPFLAGMGAAIIGVLVLVSPVVPTLLVIYPAAGFGLVSVVASVVVGIVAGKVYHDTALAGNWSAVTTLDDDSVPAALTEAGAAEDPASTARCDIVRAAPGDEVRIVGTVETTADGVHVTDGVVSTRGRWFLALAAVLDAVRTFLLAVLLLLVAAVGAALLAPSIVTGVVSGV